MFGLSALFLMFDRKVFALMLVSPQVVGVAALGSKDHRFVSWRPFST